MVGQTNHGKIPSYERCQVLFSPSYQQINPGELADWILA